MYTALIGYKEHSEAVMGQKFDISHQDVNTLLFALDMDNDGYITQEDFLGVCLRAGRHRFRLPW